MQPREEETLQKRQNTTLYLATMYATGAVTSGAYDWRREEEPKSRLESDCILPGRNYLCRSILKDEDGRQQTDEEDMERNLPDWK